MIELILLSRAEIDIQTAFNRCEDYQLGRGEIFIHQLDAAFGLLRKYPEIAPVYSGPYRRMLLKNLPYGIFYQAQSIRIVVVAILDLRQDPQSLKTRLFGKNPDSPTT